MKCLCTPARRNSPDVIDTRSKFVKDFLQLMQNNDDGNFIYLDEVGYTATMRARYGRSEKGTNANHVITDLRSRNISVCCEMTNNSILSYKPRQEIIMLYCLLNF